MSTALDIAAMREDISAIRISVQKGAEQLQFHLGEHAQLKTDHEWALKKYTFIIAIINVALVLVAKVAFK